MTKILDILHMLSCQHEEQKLHQYSNWWGGRGLREISSWIFQLISGCSSINVSRTDRVGRGDYQCLKDEVIWSDAYQNRIDTAYLSFPLSLHIYQIAQGKAWHSIWNCNGFVFFVAKRTTRNVEFFCVKLKTKNHNLDHPHRSKHTKKMTFIN